MATSLNAAAQSLQIIAPQTRHLPQPASITCQQIGDELTLHLLFDAAEHVAAWERALHLTGSGQEWTASTGQVHTSAEGTVHDVPVRLFHVTDAPDHGTPRDRLAEAAREAAHDA